jgi:lipopolysaccharide export LptBFGC system permease protein LptF
MSVVARYVLSEFLRLFAICMLGFLLIYVLVDLFDRLDGFLKYHASIGAVVRYLMFKVPLIVTQLVPIATLGAVLFTLGTMARHSELTAMRASGISTVQIAAPLFVVAVVLSLVILAWNETVVPYATERSRLRRDRRNSKQAAQSAAERGRHLVPRSKRHLQHRAFRRAYRHPRWAHGLRVQSRVRPATPRRGTDRSMAQ